MDLPIERLLKKKSQVELARLQDEVIDIVYNISDAVLHGGTAIWRCYGGKRFSEDLDFYCGLTQFKEKFKSEVEKHKLKVTKFRETDNLIFAKISDDKTEVSVEINKMDVKGSLKIYEKADGRFINIYALTPEELILEKMSAYKNRKLVRDVYDVFYLMRFVDKSKIKDELEKWLKELEKPVDEEILPTLIYSGIVPSLEDMVRYIKEWI